MMDAGGKGFDGARYKGYLVCADVRGALAYLDACGDGERAQALRRRFTDSPRSCSGIVLIDQVLDAYHRYFQRCFGPGSDTATTPRTQEPPARNGLERELQAALRHPDENLDELEQTMTGMFQTLGLHYLGGKTCGYYGPYLWRETTETAYEVEIPSGKEHVMVHWMDGFLSRGWLDWLSGGEYGASGWAKEDGLYCVRSVYASTLEAPSFTISFLKHEAQHQADYRYGAMAPRDLEYRAKLVELMSYQDPSFLRVLLASGDLSDKENAHAYAAASIVDGLSASLGDRFHRNGADLLRQAADVPSAWNDLRDSIHAEAACLLEEHTEMVRKACAVHAVPIAVI